ncbi:replication-associated protein [Caerostris darwini]|uniref:Replication-associated protein n=1 Tax=Caerostris darwini TaxID=1538125 RepID=A0AAV4W508_9ARAC|nr:replication-associated protein [Caerostris darwini]
MTNSSNVNSNSFILRCIVTIFSATGLQCSGGGSSGFMSSAGCKLLQEGWRFRGVWKITTGDVFSNVLSAAERGDVESIKTDICYKENILSSVAFRAELTSCGVWICGALRCGKDASVRDLGDVPLKVFATSNFMMKDIFRGKILEALKVHFSIINKFTGEKIKRQEGKLSLEIKADILAFWRRRTYRPWFRRRWGKRTQHLNRASDK